MLRLGGCIAFFHFPGLIVTSGLVSKLGARIVLAQHCYAVKLEDFS